MNKQPPTQDTQNIPDIQGTLDTRQLPIQRVGVKGVRYPMRWQTKTMPQSTIGTWNLMVHLSAKEKGTHMSRFIALLHESFEKGPPMSICTFGKLMRDMLGLFNTSKNTSHTGHIEVMFPYCIKKIAPVSTIESWMDYDVGLIGDIHDDQLDITLKTIIPVTSLCPCSKEISQYGAHNQRSHITVEATIADKQTLDVDAFIAMVEQQASCELYGLLKRVDEKYVTERAYENPKFVEDLVRDVAVLLNAEDAILAYRVEAENFESIHNHSAYALIAYDKRINIHSRK